MPSIDRDQAEDEAPHPRAGRDRRQRDPGAERGRARCRSRRPRGGRGARGRRAEARWRSCRLAPAHARHQPEHDHVGADEEDDETLDQQRQVRGELGLEDLRVEVPRRRARRASPPKRSAASATPIAVLRPSSATAMPTNAIVAPWMSPVASRNCQPSTSTAPARPGEGAGDRHREEVVARDADAAVAGRLGVEADRLDAVAERRPAEDQPVDDERADRDEEADVEALEHRVAPEDRQLGALDDVVRDRARTPGDRSAAARRARTGRRRSRSRSS